MEAETLHRRVLVVSAPYVEQAVKQEGYMEFSTMGNEKNMHQKPMQSPGSHGIATKAVRVSWRRSVSVTKRGATSVYWRPEYLQRAGNERGSAEQRASRKRTGCGRFGAPAC